MTAAPNPALEPFVRKRTMLLTSYRKDGTPVGTPVHVAVAGDRAFFRTWDATWKAKRLSRNPAVEVAPSTFRGRPTGVAVRAHARLLSGEEEATAARALSAKYRLLHGAVIPWIYRRKGWRGVLYEITPAEGQ